MSKWKEFKWRIRCYLVWYGFLPTQGYIQGTRIPQEFYGLIQWRKVKSDSFLTKTEVLANLKAYYATRIEDLIPEGTKIIRNDK